MTDIQARLFALADEKYRDFNAKLVPNVDNAAFIGVRTPALRQLAKELSGTAEREKFMAALPHEYFEENQLHAFFIEQIRDFDTCIAALEAFLPYVDNWATCDQMNPKVLGRDKARLLINVRAWLKSDKCCTVRYGIGQLMRWYLNEDYSDEYPRLVCSVESEEYYVRMMVAWFFATALAKQYDAVLPYFTAHRLNTWTHNKAIQKALESYRVSDEHKAQLRALKIKERKNA